MKIRPASRLSERASNTAKPRKPSLADAIKKRAVSSIEALEARIAPATVVTLSGGHLSVQGDAGNDQLSFTVDTINGTLTILNAAGENVTTAGVIDGDGVVNNQVTFALNAITGDFTVNTGTGTDSLLFDSNLSLPGNFTATTSGGITFNAGLSFIAADKNIAANAGTSILLTGTSNLATAGTGSISLTSGRDISLASGSILAAANGNIVLNANIAGTGTGTFAGITVAGSISSSGSGAIQLTGVGGNTGTSNHGINLNGGQILSTGTGAVTLDGRGGGESGFFDNDGIIFRNSSQISATSGGISLTGTIGVGGPGSGSEGLNLESTSITSSASNIALTTDVGLLIQGSATVNAGANTVTLQPKTNGTPINLGTYSDGYFGLNDGQLDRVTAGTVQIGNSTAGAISVSAPISHGNNLSLVSNAGVSGTGALDVTGGKNLDIIANGAINLSGVLTVSGSTTLAAGAANDITLSNAGNNFSSVRVASGNNVTLVDANAITFGGGTSTISGTLNVSAGGAITQTGALVVTGSSTFAAGGNAITLNNAGNNFATVNVTSGATVTLRDDSGFNLGTTNVSTLLSVESAGAITQSGVLNGLGGLTKLGTGTLTLSLANGYTGATTISAGTVALQSTYASSSFAIASGAVLELNVASGSLDYASASFTGNGTLRKTGNGMAFWGGTAATFALGAGGLIDVQGGTFTGGSSSNEVWTNNLASLNVAAGAAFQGVEAYVRVDQITGAGLIASGFNGFGSVTFGANNGSSTFSGVLADSVGHVGHFTKAGTGTITLTGTNTYSGTTTITAGTLQVGAGGTTGTLGSGAVTNNSNLVFNRSNAFTIGNSISGTGTLTVANSGGATFSGNVSQGAVTLTASTGTIAFDGNLTATSLNTTNGGYSVALRGTTTSITNDVNFLNTGTVTLGNGGDLLTFSGGLATSGNPSNPSGTTIAGTVRTNGQNIDLGVVTLAGNSTIDTTNAGAVPAGANLSIAGTVNADAAANNRTLTLAAGSGLLTLSGTVGGVQALHTLTTTSGTLASLPALNIGAGGLSVSTTGGAITQTGAIVVTGPSSFAAGGNAITLTNTANNFVGAVSLSNTGANAIALTDANALILGTVSAGQDLTLTASGAITQTGTITATGGSTILTAGATNDITLSNAGNNFATVRIVSANDVTLNDVSGYNIGGGAISVVSGNFTTTAGGSITDTNSLQVAGTATFNVGATNDVILDLGGVQLNTVVITSARNVQLNDSNGGLNFGNSTISGTLTVTAVGAITDSGNLSVAGNASFTAGAANNITLDSAGNDFSSVRIVSGNNVTLVDANAIDLGGGGASVISGDLTVTAGGAITDSGNLTVTGNASFTAGAANNITLDSTGNNFSSVRIVSGNNVTLVDANAIAFGSGTSTISGTLSVTAGGAITQSGALVVAGTSSFTAGNNGILLTNGNNDFVGAVSLSNSGANAVSVQDVNAIVLGTVTVGNSLAVATSGTITQTGVITVPSGTTLLSAGSGNDITLSNANNNFSNVRIPSANNVILTDVNAIDFTAGSSVISGDLTVTAGGMIHVHEMSVAGLATFNAGTNTIDIGDPAAATHFGSIRFIGGTVTIQEDSGTVIGGTAPSTATSLTITSSGAITQTQPVTVTGTSSFDAGANAITLTDAANDFIGAVSLSNSGVNNVAITDANAILIGTSSVGSGTLQITANGISQNGTITQAASAGAVTLTGGTGSIILNLNNDFTGAVTATSTGAGQLISLRDTVGGLNVASASTNNGAISLEAVSGNLSVTSATAGNGTVTLLTTTSGNIQIGSVSTSGTANITSAGAIEELGADVGADLTAGTANLTAISGIGTIAPIETALSNLSAQTVTGGIFLGNTGVLSVSNYRATTSGNLVLTNIGALTTTGIVSTTSGTINLMAHSPITIGANVTASGAITIDALEATIPTPNVDNLTVNSGVSIQSTGSTVTLRAGDNISTNATSTISGNSGVLVLAAYNDNDSNGAATLLGTINSGGSVTLTARGDITLGSVNAGAQVVTATSTQGAIVDGNGVSLNILAADAVLSAATGIGVGNALETQLNRLEAQTTSGGIYIDEANALTIGVPGGLNGLTATAGNIVVNSGALTIAEQISTPNDVTLTAAGTITEVGVGAINASTLVTTSSGGQALYGPNTVARFDATNTAGGDVALYNTAPTLTVARIANVLGSATVQNTGNIQLGDTVLNANVAVQGIAAIIASGAITDGNLALNNITASGTVLISGAGVGSAGERIETNVSNLEADGGTGGVYITEANALTIGGVVPGPVGVGAAGDIAIQSGALTIQEDIDTPAIVTLNASGSITETTGAVKNAAHLITTSIGGQQLTGANTVRAFTATNTGSGTAIVLENNSLPGGLTINNVTNQTGGYVGINNDGAVTIVGAVTSGQNPLPLGGDISIASTGLLTVAASGSVNSRGGSGGMLTLANQVLIEGAVIVGSGNITLTGAAGDMNINAPITVETPLTLLATGNINIRAKVETTLTTSNLTAVADTDFDAQGGIRVFPQGELKAGKDLTLTGSDYTGTPELDSIIIDADSAGLQQVGAFGNIRFLNGGGAPVGAATYLSGYVNAITNGNVTFEHAVQLAADTARVSTHGAGNILFNDTINGAFDLRLSTDEGLVTFDGAVGTALVPVGNIRVDSALDVTVGAAFNAETFTIASTTGTVSFLAPVNTFASGANLVVNANALNVEGAVNANGGNIVWSVDNLAIEANVSGTGSLTVQPLTQGRSIGVNAAGDLNLTTAEIAYLQNGFASIQIGSTTGTSVITTGGATFLDPVSIVSPATGGAINVTGSIVGTTNASVALRAPAITLGVPAPVAAISTESGAVSLNGNVTLAADTAISTVAAGTGGAFVQDGTINGAYALSISTGTAPITFNGIGSTTSASIGGTSPLASLTLNGGVVSLRPQIVTTGSQSYTGTEINLLGGSLRSTTSGTIEFFGPVDLSQGISVTTSGFAGTGVTFHGDVRNEVLNAGALRITAGSGTVSFAGDIGTSLAPLASFAVQSAGLAEFAGELYAQGAIQIAADEINFNGGAGTIHGSGELVLKPNDPTVVTQVGGAADQVGIFDLTLTDIAALADGFSKITIGRDLGNAGLQIVSAPGGVTFTDPVVFEQSGRAGVITVLGNLHGTGNASFDFRATTVSLDGGIASLSITTQGQAVSFDATIIASDVTVNTGAGSGAITFRSTVLDFEGGNDLTLAAGAGDISLMKSVGSAKGVTLGAIDITTSGLARINSAVRADSFALNKGGFQGTAEILGKSITTTNVVDGQLYNADIQLNSSVRFTTNNGPATFGGEIDSRLGKAYSALVSAGTGNVVFEGNIGTDVALGTLRAKTKGTVAFEGDVAARGVAVSAASFTLQDVHASISQSYASLSTTVPSTFAGALTGAKLKISSKSSFTSTADWNITGRVVLKASGLNSISLTGDNQFGDIDVAAANVEIHEAGAMQIRTANVSSTLTLQATGDITDGVRTKIGKLVATSTTGGIVFDGINRIASLGVISAQTGVLIVSGGTTLSLTDAITTQTGNIVLVGNDRSSHNVVLAGGSIVMGPAAGYFRIYTFDESLSNLGALGAVYTEVLGNRYPYAPTGADALVDAVIAVQA